jgi:hypothetical protein
VERVFSGDRTDRSWYVLLIIGNPCQPFMKRKFVDSLIFHFMYTPDDIRNRHRELENPNPTTCKDQKDYEK